MKHILLTLLLLIFAVSSFGQELKVKSFTHDVMNRECQIDNNLPKDLNGKPCALLKVIVADKITKCEGGNVGNIVDEGMVKRIYISPTAKYVTLYFQNHFPVKIGFADYVTTNLQSMETYEVTLISSNKERTSQHYNDAIVPFKIDKVTFNMIRVDGGTFTMGATPEQKKPYDNEKPCHKVSLSSYYIGETEVTEALWQAVMESNPSYKGFSANPKTLVSWNDCQVFIRKLNEMTGGNFRLPTEAEWEFAARGGRESKGYQYSGGNDAKDVAVHYVKPKTKKEKIAAWYGATGAKDVAQKKENELGIYDMSGNVWEMCSDWKGDYSESKQTNPSGPKEGTFRVIRGGSWNVTDDICRVSIRNGINPNQHDTDIGFRLAFSVDEKNAPETYFNAPLPLVGSLKVMSSVDDADVYIDSVYVGKVNQLFPKTTVGVHIITVKKDGYKDFSEKIVVKENLQSDLKAELYKPCTPKNISLKITGGTERLVGAAVSHYREWKKQGTQLSDLFGTVQDFTITNGDIITISYYGYKQKEILIKDVDAIGNILNVQMTKGNSNTKEIMVVGD